MNCRLQILLLLVGGQLAAAQEGCCAVKEVQGDDSLAGTYRLATPGDGDSFPSVCIDSCAYTRDGNSNSRELFCFKTEGATHTTECTEEGTTAASGGSGGGLVLELEPISATQSSTYVDRWGTYGAGNCIDGDTGGGVFSGGVCVSNNEAIPWIAVDYGTRVIVERVEIFNRADCCGGRTRNVDVRVSDELPTSGDLFSGGTLLGHFAGPGTTGQHIIISGQETSGRYVIVQMDNGGDELNLQEVKAFGRVASEGLL